MKTSELVEKTMSEMSFTQKSFADALNESLVDMSVSRVSVSHWINGRNEPETDFLESLLVAYDPTDWRWDFALACLAAKSPLVWGRDGVVWVLRTPAEYQVQKEIAEMDDNYRQLLDAVGVAIEKKTFSASDIQRNLRVGYPRAARIIDYLCDAKVIKKSPANRYRWMIEENFECAWCEIAGEDAIYPTSELGGFCQDFDRPICDSCLESATVI